MTDATAIKQAKGTHEGSDATIEALIRRAGERVRKARERKGLSRRALSETSGVSPRYLAQLEAGEGNISIGLLGRIAIALDYRIEWFIGEDDPWTSEVVRLTELYRGADRETRSQAMRVLGAVPSANARAQRICLTGLRGAGKSTLGRAAGAFLEVPFVELNQEIETQAGMPIEEILALYGQEGYRRLEADALDRVIDTKEQVILAVAGGIVAEPSTYATLLSRFHTVWIKASPQEHMDRVRAQGDERPMAGNPAAMEQLKSILTSREMLYGKATAMLDTSGATKDASLAELIALIEEHKFIS